MKTRLFALTLTILFGLQSLISQTHYKYYQDGLVVFQLKLDAKRILSKDQWVDFKNYPLFTDFLSGYDIVEVKQLHPDLDDELLNRTYQIRINDFTKVDDLAKVLGTHSTIEYAELKALHYSTYTPNDPLYGTTNQWGLFAIDAEDAWDLSLGNSNVVVAATDDAMELTHPDLQNVFVTGRNMQDNSSNPSPCGNNDGAHGTHVSGIIGAQTNNSVGVASIGAGVSVMPVKIGDCSNGGLPYGYEGVVWAANNGADIINMSWGSSSWGSYGQNVINNAWNQGVILVAAAGNDGNSSLSYPAAYNNVIAVANTNQSDLKASSSQYGTWIDISAPGTQIASTVPGGNPYIYMSGTSMASPMVAGLLGLMKSYAPTATRTQLIDCLLNSADAMPNSSHYNNGQMGSGRINAHQALLCLSSYNNNLDVALEEIISPSGGHCSGNFTPEVVIKNYGSTTLTSATISYNWGAAPQTYNWSGNLTTGQTATITLPTVSLADGSYVFTATTSSPNGQADENTTNDTQTTNFSIDNSGELVTLTVNTDCWGNETTWEIRDNSNNLVASGGPYATVVGGTSNTYSLCLTQDCYTFTIFDSYGDGMSGAQYQQCSVNGYYEMLDANNGVLFEMTAPNGNFGSSSAHQFCVGGQSNTYDAGISAITSPTALVCSPTISPVVVLRNYGSSTLTSVAIVYDVGGPQQTYNWTGSLATGQTQTVNLPAITVGAGQTLTVSTQNPNGNTDENPSNDEEQRSLIIQTTAASLPFTEDFENGATGWLLSNPDGGITWTINTIGGTTPGNKAAKMDFFNYQNGGGQRDGLLSPKISLNGLSSADLYFEHAFRRYNQNSNDSLFVYISIDCGSTWTRVFQGAEDGTGVFATQTTTMTEFTPSAANDWCIQPISQQTPGASCFTISLDAFVGNDIFVMFEAYKGSNRGNNLYIDNINIQGITSGNTSTPNFTTDVNQVCTGGTVQFTDASTENPSAWNWTFPGGNPATSTAQNPSVIYNTSGTYDVVLEVTNAHGTQTQTFTNQITVNAIPTVSANASSTTICVGDHVNLTASGANSYTWNNGLGNGASHTVSPTTTTTYEVTGTSSAGCTNTATVTVNVNPLPSVTANASLTTICAGDNVNLTASGANSYTWNNGLGNGASHTVSPTTTTTYEVTGSSGGCDNTATVTVTVNPSPTLNVNASSTTICAGDNVNLTASGANSYTWNNGLGSGANHTVSPTMTTTYQVTGTTGNCTQTETVTVNVSTELTVMATASETEICAGESVTITASGASNYTWDNGLGNGINHVVTPTSTTTYEVTGTSANCTGTASVTVTVNTPPSTPVIVQNDNQLSVNLQAGETAEWFYNGSSVGTGATLPITQDGHYVVVITNANGCIASADGNFTVDTSSLTENEGAGQFKLYPNPTENWITIEWTGTEKLKNIRLYDAQGRLVNNYPVPQEGEIKLALAQFQTGVYIVRLETETGVYSKRVTKR